MLVADKVAVTIGREGVAVGLSRAASTALIAVVVTGLGSIPGVRLLLLRFPELVLAEIALIIIVSAFCDWRLVAGVDPGTAGARDAPGTPSGRNPRAAGWPAGACQTE